MTGTLILALDLGVRTGYAIGAPGQDPQQVISGAVTLKRPEEPAHVAFGNLIEWLNTRCKQYRPAFIFKEAPLNLTFQTRNNRAKTVELTLGLHAIVEGMAHRWGAQPFSVHDATVRKHFIGKGRMGSRAATKLAVIRRAELLDYMTRGLNDADRSDACAIWDYATRMQAQPQKLFLFGEAA